MEGKLQQRRRLSKEKQVGAAKPPPEPRPPLLVGLAQAPAQPKEKRVVFSSLEQRRRESKERKLEFGRAVEGEVDTPRAKQGRAAPVREEEEVYVQVQDAPEGSVSSQNSNIKPEIKKNHWKHFNTQIKSKPAKPHGTVTEDRKPHPRPVQSSAVKPSRQQGAPKTPDTKSPSAEEHGRTRSKSPAHPKKQLMVLKIKFEHPIAAQIGAEKTQRAAQDRTRTSTRPKKQPPPPPAKKMRSTIGDRPAASSKPPSKRQQAASNVKEADRLLTALNLIINSRVDQQ